MNERDKQMLRLMAWKRAKGELEGMLQTYQDFSDNYFQLKEAIDDFIKDIEGNGRHE